MESPIKSLPILYDATVLKKKKETNKAQLLVDLIAWNEYVFVAPTQRQQMGNVSDDTIYVRKQPIST